MKATSNKRRQVLKTLTTAPLLPWAMQSATGWAAGQTSVVTKIGKRHKPARKWIKAEFEGMAAPTLENPAEMATMSVASSLNLTFADGSRSQYKLAYQPFFVTGDKVPDGRGGTLLAGAYWDFYGKPIMDESVPGKARQFFSDCPDGMSLLTLSHAKVPGIKGKAVFAVVQFEYISQDQRGASLGGGVLPSPIAVLTLDQDQTTGQLTLVKYHAVDTSPAKGLWTTCGASLSPWNTHLSSEEYEPDASTIAGNAQFKLFSQYLFGDQKKANPYHYGHVPEVTVQPDGTATIKKHYCLGRLSHELIQVMPDERTVLMGDDHTNGGLFLFVADKARDLSAGTLYVARLDKGLSLDTTAKPVDLSWISLGHATSDEIEQLANRLTFDDILSISKMGSVLSGYRSIYINGQSNWIQLKPGMEKAAAFLETHRYAALVGGSMAFTKLEGTTVNIKDKVAYSALQNIQDSMVKQGKGWYESSQVALEKPLKAGAVLAHQLGGGMRDTQGQPIHSDWVPRHTRVLLKGEDIAADALGNTAHPEKIANPDNLKFSETLRTLFIGEDSNMHVNSFLWAYQVDTGVLSRLLSVPAGAESTGLHAVDDIHGWTYITSNFQHAGDWSGIHGKVAPALQPYIDQQYREGFGAAVGYITALQQAIHL